MSDSSEELSACYLMLLLAFQTKMAAAKLPDLRLKTVLSDAIGDISVALSTTSFTIYDLELLFECKK